MGQRIIIAALLMLPMLSLGQNACKKELMRAYDQLDRSSATMKDGKTFLMTYTLSAVFNAGGKIDSSSYTAKIAGNEQMRSFSTDIMDVFQDEKVTVSVSKPDKEIHIIKTPLADFRANHLSKMQLIQDTVIQSAHKIQCREADHGMVYYKLSFMPGQLHLNGLKTMRVGLNDGQFEWIQLFYYSGHQYVNAKVQFKRIDFDAKDQKLLAKGLNHIYNKGNLKPQYHGYKVIDHRQ